MTEAFAPLRPVDVFPVKEGEQTRFALKDLHQIQEKTLLLSAPAYFIAIQLDGNRGIREIQAEFAKHFNKAILPEKTVREVVDVLDRNYFLDNARFRLKMKETAEAYRALPNRKAAHQGSVYPENPEEVVEEIHRHFNDPRGPGWEKPDGEGHLAGLVAPHIDYGRGGPGYAWAYREVLERPMADLYVLLGVAHVSPPTPFVLSAKNYETPFGPAAADKGFAERLASRLSFDPFEHEIVHRTEHSLEFQALYLRWCAKKRGEDFKILPILVSGLGTSGDAEDPDRLDPRAEEFLRVLKEELGNYPGRTCVLAGVDLAHIGRRFGDPFDVDAGKLAEMEKADRKSLEAVETLEPAGFYGSVVENGKNPRNVCGLGALYAFADLLQERREELSGKLLHYGHASDPLGGEVSFASLRFLGPEG